MNQIYIKKKSLSQRSIWSNESIKNLIILSISFIAVLLYFILSFISLPHYGQIPIAEIPLILAIMLCGIPLCMQIIFKLLRFDFGADLLAIIALVTSIILNQYLAAVLIIIMLASGQALEAYAVRKASSVLHALADRMPVTARRKQGDQLQEIPVDNIRIGDEILILPHETVPVDGVVITGHSSMDESYLTGEPYHLSKAPGASVISGSINGETALIVRTEKLSSDSRYAQIMQVMQDAEQKRPAMRRIGDQLGALFAPIALIFAFSTWYFTNNEMLFLSVLVVATPCPLLIAIPITLISAISMAASKGIIIKDPTVLERLPTCRTAIFDKTGTLTYGNPELTEIITKDPYTQEEILQLVASLEFYSKHPLAGAILKAAKQKEVRLLEVTSISEKPGQGLYGIVGNHNIFITSRHSIIQSNPEFQNVLPATLAGLECMVMVDSKYAATFSFRDTPLPGSKLFISHLAPFHGINKLILLSGDRDSEVNYLSELLGIKQTFASQSPEQKVAIVQEEASKAPTLFMGDGINDAPALAVATVGLAFGQHSNVTSEAAGATILEKNLAKVDELIHISIAMRRIMLQSALGGIVLSLIAMGCAALGFITPVKGALLQELIDILAITNSLRLTWGQKIKIDI